ncbi:transcriptional regulator family: Fungal Specific TF [Aspergillus niger]|nr:transcriptional regulator family: Fungal Specific TF [Aspergillus niger]
MSPSPQELASRLNQSGKQRQKRWVTRTRTGCITCRIRHIKCDETKPSCQRCTSTGRKCDGYQDPRAKQITRRKSKRAQPDGLLQIPSAWSFIGGKPMNHEHFHYFVVVTAPTLTGYFNSGLWSYTLPQISYSYPALWHAITALASLHRDFLEDVAPLAITQDCSTVRVRFALQQHTRSIQSLRELMSKPCLTVHDKMAVLATCIIFICLLSLQGFHSQAMAHVASAMVLCQQWNREFQTHSHASETIASVILLLAQLDSQVRHIFAIQGLTVPWTTEFKLPVTEGCFTSLDEAHVSLEVNVNNRALKLLTSGIDISAPEALAKKEYCLHELYRWNSKLETYIAVSQHETDNTTMNALYLRRLYAKVMLSLDPSKGELAHDDFIDDYAQMLDLANRILESLNTPVTEEFDPGSRPAKQRHFSVESTVTETLFLIGVRCREPTIRGRALELMRLYPRREGMCGTMLALKLGETLAEIEGTACHTAPPGLCSDGTWVCADHRVTKIQCKDVSDRKVAVLMRTAGEEKRGFEGNWFVFHKTW